MYSDAIDLLATLVRRIVVARMTEEVPVHEVICRLYGGWFDITGGATEQRSWILKHLRRLQGLADGVRLVPETADSLLCFPYARLRGTYKNKQQKMVDQMLAHDAVFLARSSEHSSLLLIADDDDYVPASIVIATQTSTRLIWLRQRASGTNDSHLDQSRVEFLTDGDW